MSSMNAISRAHTHTDADASAPKTAGKTVGQLASKAASTVEAGQALITSLFSGKGWKGGQ
jgi:hypothetical protein